MGVFAALVMAVAFLPVFYSHLALNDVPALLPLAVSVWGSAGVLTRGRRLDWAVAGAGLGLAAATKYTAGIVVLPLLVAAAYRLSDRGARAEALRGAAAATALAAAFFLVANPHALLSWDEFWADVSKQEEAASGFGKLGLDQDSGILYYLGVLTWGFGWVPLAAALAGALVAFRADVRRGLFLVPWPLVFIAYMGTQERFFGRWLLPALPALAILAGLGATRLLDLIGSRRPRVAGGCRRHGGGGARRAGSLLQRARRPRAVQRRHAQSHARLDGSQHPRGGEGGGRARRAGRLVRRRRRTRRGGGARGAG